MTLPCALPIFSNFESSSSVRTPTSSKDRVEMAVDRLRTDIVDVLTGELQSIRTDIKSLKERNNELSMENQLFRALFRLLLANESKTIDQTIVNKISQTTGNTGMSSMSIEPPIVTAATVTTMKESEMIDNLKTLIKSTPPTSLTQIMLNGMMNEGNLSDTNGNLIRINSSDDQMKKTDENDNDFIRKNEEM